MAIRARSCAWCCALACALACAAPALAHPHAHHRVDSRASSHVPGRTHSRAGGTAPDGRCGTREAIAHIRDDTASFAQRNRISDTTFCALNGIARGSALVHHKSYVTARGDVGERLVRGESMGPSTSDYVVVNPARAWGQKSVVSLLRAAAHRVQARFPGEPRIVFEDLSIERGGCLAPHREHRSGLEVDAGLYHKGVGALTHLLVATQGNFDAQREWMFLQALLETGRVDKILLDPRIQAWLHSEAVRQQVDADKLARWFPVGPHSLRAVFTDATGHDNHAHIRFKCAPGECDLPAELVPEDETEPVAPVQSCLRPRSVPDWRAPLCLPLCE